MKTELRAGLLEPQLRLPTGATSTVATRSISEDLASHRPQTGEVPAGRRSLVSMVVPVFNESEVIATFYERATAALGGLTDCDYELLFVDDGSTDDTYRVLTAFAAADPRVRLVKFSRNFGHQIAITAGVDHASGDCVIVIDADLQDPPEVVRSMIDQWRAGFDVVYGVRSERDGETPMKLMTASIFYRLLRRLTNVQIPANVGDFRLMSRRAADELRRLREKDRFVRGLVSWIGFKQTGVTYSRDKRYAGETKYPYRKMLKFAFDGITSFSSAPLKIATWTGYAAALLAVLYLISVFVQKLMGVTVDGWATIMVAMLFLGSVQLICLGILGEYLGRIFNEVKPRPMYVVEEVRSSDIIPPA
ncbi:MAG TPA: glycosyltransferase family 2 protein [Vicinamibacterales bacterium]|nr:glycosyltransferase family 2 protein [Vicinamibacterales bacterium]